MTRNSIRDLVRKKLGETTAAFWTDDEIYSYINLAGHDVAWKTKVIRSSGYISTVENTSEYVLSTSFSSLLFPLRVYFYQDASVWEKIPGTTIDDMDRDLGGWKSASAGTPIKYYFEYERNKTLGIYPKPNSTNAGANYMEIIYATDFTELTGDTMPTGIPVPLQLAMVDFAVAIGFDTRGMGAKATGARTQYNIKIAEWLGINGKDFSADTDDRARPEQSL